MTLKSNFKFYLTDKFNSGATTVTISNDVETNSVVELSTATSILIRHPDKADVIERITATATGGTLTTSARGLSNANPGVASSANEQDWRPGAICYVTIFPEDFLEKDATDTVSGDITYSGESNHSGGSYTEFATTAARDAALGANGAATEPRSGVYCADTGLHYNYNLSSAQWEPESSGIVTPNMSESVTGKGRYASQVQHDAGTDADTGNPLVSRPSVIQAGIQKGSALYAGASAVGTDSYAVTMTPTLTAYTTGMKISFKADVANTGACTIDIDTLGAKSIKMIDGTDTLDGEIKANQFVELMYDGTNMVYQNPASSLRTRGGDYSITAGENIDAGEVLRYGLVGDGETVSFTGTGTVIGLVGYSTSQYDAGQSFTTTDGGFLSSITVKMFKEGTPGGTLGLSIYSDTSGTLVETSSTTFNESTLTGGGTDLEFSFAGTKYLSKDTVYYFKVEISGRAVSTSDYSKTLGDNSGYTGGTAYTITDGGVWSTDSSDMYFSVVTTDPGEDSSKAYLASASTAWYSSVIGLANYGAVTDGTVRVDLVTSNRQSGLTQGSTYYLSDTDGAVASSAGTVSVELGDAFTTTTLVLKSLV